jgi:hypothetical protein
MQDFQKQKCEPLHVDNVLILTYYNLFCLKYYPPQPLFIDKTNPFKIKCLLLLKMKEICLNNK